MDANYHAVFKTPFLLLFRELGELSAVGSRKAKLKVEVFVRTKVS